jgi:hypothetical protein
MQTDHQPKKPTEPMEAQQGSKKAESSEVQSYMKWAWEALVNYAAYRVQGDAPGIDRAVPMPADWPKDQIPLLADLWESPEEIDYEYKDYLLVRACISVQIRDFPQDAMLPEFLTHCLYFRRRVGDFTVFLPFGSQKVMLGSLGKSAALNAWYAVTKLLRSVAIEKEKQAQLLELAS